MVTNHFKTAESKGNNNETKEEAFNRLMAEYISLMENKKYA